MGKFPTIVCLYLMLFSVVSVVFAKKEYTEAEKQEIRKKMLRKVFIQDTDRDSVEQIRIREAANLEKTAIQQNTYKGLRTYLKCGFGEVEEVGSTDFRRYTFNKVYGKLMGVFEGIANWFDGGKQRRKIINTVDGRPRYAWLADFKKINQKDITFRTNGRVRPLEDRLFFREVKPEDEGLYTCWYVNEKGFHSVHINLTLIKVDNGWCDWNNPTAFFKVGLLTTMIVFIVIAWYEYKHFEQKNRPTGVDMKDPDQDNLAKLLEGHRAISKALEGQRSEVEWAGRNEGMKVLDELIKGKKKGMKGAGKMAGAAWKKLRNKKSGSEDDSEEESDEEDNEEKDDKGKDKKKDKGEKGKGKKDKGKKNKGKKDKGEKDKGKDKKEDKANKKGADKGKKLEEKEELKKKDPKKKEPENKEVHLKMEKEKEEKEKLEKEELKKKAEELKKQKELEELKKEKDEQDKKKKQSPGKRNSL